MITKYFKFAVLLSAVAALGACNNYSQYTDQVYFSDTDASVAPRITVDPDELPIDIPFSVAFSAKATRDISVHLEVAPELIEEYNKKNGTEYVALPAGNFTLSATSVTIPAGKAVSENAFITITSMAETDEAGSYMIPVRIARTDGVEVLESCRVLYFAVHRLVTVSAMRMFKFEADGNVPIISNAEDNYIFEAKTFAGNPQFKDMTNLTMEARVYIHQFRRVLPGDASGAASTSVMGVETHGMMRIDNGANDRRILQMGKPGHAFGGETKLEAGRWYHLAFTYDGSIMRLYIDGKEEASKEAEDIVFDYSAVNGSPTGGRGFTIGFAGNNFRPAWCDINEVRVWNVARTPMQIAGNMCSVDPQSNGLVAYWKLNDPEAGNVAYDYTDNGHSMTLMHYVLYNGPSDDKEVNEPIWISNVKCP